MTLTGSIALVAGATRGAGRGIAVALGEAGATVYCTGRSAGGKRSEYDRPETVEETAALVTEAGGEGIDSGHHAASLNAGSDGITDRRNATPLRNPSSTDRSASSCSIERTSS